MAKAKKSAAINTKKALRAQIVTTLQKTFTDLKETIGAEKFERQVKKASKVLAAGATKKPKAKKPAVKVAAKKKAS